MKKLLLSVLATTVLSTAGLTLFVGRADAVSTRHFTLDDQDDLAAGELDGTMVHTDGRVTIGAGADRIELEGASLAGAIARRGETLYVGTADEGKIFRVEGDRATVFAETGQLLVASLVVVGETLYAGTLPEGRVYAIELAGGTLRELVRLPEAEHVWSLVYDARRRKLFAGTGPQGKVFAIDPSSGAAEIWFASEQGHVLSMAVDGENVYAGTDGDALVLRLGAKGQAEVVHDFPGNEITALAARGGVVAVAANDMPAPRTPTASTKAPAAGPRPGKGRLFRVDGDGRVERVLSTDSEHYTAVAIDADGNFFAGSGKEGRVYRVAPDRTSATWMDIDERQVLAIDLQGASPVFATGDSAAIYRATTSPDEATWISKVLDAGYRARFGRLSWRASGRLALSTRSGNAEEPDDTWSEWSAATTTAGPVRSPAARFVQVRAVLETGASLRAVDLYYLPQNQRAAVRSVGVKPTKTKSADELPRPSSRIELTWQVDNPDEDTLRYRLRFRAESQSVWRPMFHEDVELTDTDYTWETSGIPDGWYVVEVVASDELANPADLELSDRGTSEPILVDNHAPQVSALTLNGRTLSGTATDAIGPIARLEYKIDTGTWIPLFPDDDLLDEATERFSIQIPESEGPHIVGVRATDARGNTAVAEIAQR